MPRANLLSRRLNRSPRRSRRRNSGRLPFLDDQCARQRGLSDLRRDLVARLPAAKDAAKGKKLVEFLKWAVRKGEKMAKDFDYAPLPDNVQERVLKRIDEIKY